MKKSVRFLALVTEAYGGRGGIAQYNRDYLSALARADGGTSIIVLPRKAPDMSAHKDARMRQLPPRSGRIAYALAAIWTAFMRPVEIVFCGHLHMAPIAALIARLKGAKLILQMHGIEAWQTPSRLVRWVAESADLILCVSRYTRRRVLEWAPIAPERVLVLPNTVSESFSPGETDLRAGLGLEGERVLLTVGRMDSREAYKGHDRVIAAMPSVIARGHDVVYVILGEGDDRSRIAALAMEAGISDRVRFMGAVNNETLVGAYRIADLYIMPSTGEGFGIAYLEAMASGTPALGLGVAGACDALADGELGSCVAETELGEAIAKRLEMPRSDPQVLASAVEARFGREAFRARARGILDALKAAA